jgi:hypothetical protein
LISYGVFLISSRDLTFEHDFPDMIYHRQGFSELGLSLFRDSFSVMKVAFLSLAVYFSLSALLAWYYAVLCRFDRHRDWMIRHIASGLWVALQRLYVVVLRRARDPAHQRAAFYDGAIVSVVFSLALAEVIIIWLRRNTKYNGRRVGLKQE